MTRSIDSLLCELAPQVLGAVVRRYGNFADGEDAVQEALLAAAARTPNLREQHDLTTKAAQLATPSSDD